MTEVEWTPKALDLLEGLETDAQERLVKKLDEAKDSPIASRSLLGIRTTSSGPATIEPS